MKWKRRTTIFTCLAAAVAGCSAGPRVESLTGSEAYIAQDPDDPLAKVAAAACQQIGWHLLRQGDAMTNQVLSPASLGSALALVGLGASDTSATSLDELFGMKAEDRAAGINALRAGLVNYDSLPGSIDMNETPEHPIVHLASRLLICDDDDPKKPFLDAIKRHFDASVERVRKSDAQASLDTWAKKHTAGLIEKSGIKVTPETLLIVQDVLLFAARWKNQFKHSDASLIFTTGGGDKVNIKALRDTLPAKAAAGQGWEAVRLAYDDYLAMDILLPERGTHPLSWSPDVLQETHEALSSAPRQQVKVTMPPADLTANFNLKTLLSALGVTLDHFDGVYGGAEIEQAVQQVRLRVNAKGTVGAALTEGTFLASALVAQAVLTVDHPYVMRVLDVRTGWPLFLAVVSTPAQ